MKPYTPIRLLILWCGIICCSIAHANNIFVSNISLTGRNLSSQFVLVQFNLSWENSWRTSTSAPFNWDAAWVFVKYKVGATGDWKHATLSTSGHTIPSGATTTQSDATGMFIYRSADGTGTFSPSGIQLRWNYGSDGVSNESKITVRVYAVEMVYNQVGGFQAGSGGQNTGELRTANDVSLSGTAASFTITGTLPTVQGNSSAASPTNLAARANASIDLTATTTASLNTAYPTGFEAFYSMKYEISQQQYVEFLNTLTYTQQAARTATAPNSAPGTGALSSTNLKRNGIDIQISGTSATIPAIYACNLNGNTTYNEEDDGQHIACNFLTWDDLTAYLDWACLRPMTELEYEKSSRGNQTPIPNEYPWGSTSATILTGIANDGFTNEVGTNTGANININNGYAIGPIRTGLFASSTTSRTNSGAGYYGNMELGGNLWERVVTLGNSTGRDFSGNHGNGSLLTSGASDVSGWPVAAGSGWKGGTFDIAAANANTSDRSQAAVGSNSRSGVIGGRGVRSISSGIVTDGLVLWLDAGIAPSYPTSGTTWTDLSGNRNNGTLTNGPTYNSANGGSIVFDGVNDYVNAGNLGTFYPQGTISYWMNSSVVENYRNTFSTNYLGNNNGIRFEQSTGAFVVVIGNASGSYGGYYYQTSNFISNTWYQIVLTWNTASNNVIGYLNNVQKFSSTHSLWPSSLPSISIGSGFDNSRYFTGKISNVSIYNRSLTAAEITQNFNAQKARFGL